MGMFEKIENLVEGHDQKLLHTGQLGRAVVQHVTLTGATLQRPAQPVSQRCRFDLMVYIDDTPPFPAQTVKLIPQYALDQFVPGQSVVAVRVDPTDRSRVVIDLATQPPAVRLAAGSTEFSAASILATGTPCQAIIVGIEPAGVKNPSGFDVHFFTLTIIAEGKEPYQITVGNPAPPEALPVMYPGSKIPAKYLPSGPQEAVAIDWQAGIAAAGR